MATCSVHTRKKRQAIVASSFDMRADRRPFGCDYGVRLKRLSHSRVRESTSFPSSSGEQSGFQRLPQEARLLRSERRSGKQSRQLLLEAGASCEGKWVRVETGLTAPADALSLPHSLALVNGCFFDSVSPTPGLSDRLLLRLTVCSTAAFSDGRFIENLTLS